MGRQCAGTTRSSGWSSLSKALGVLAVAVLASLGAALPAGAASASRTVLPATAGGCNQAICIYVVCTKVTKWTTEAVLQKPTCTFAMYWANGTLVRQGTVKCGSKGADVTSAWSNPGHFPAGTEVCNTWTGIPGGPCETSRVTSRP